MSVEYRHFLVVNEPNWVPKENTAMKVERVLHQWGLLKDITNAVDLSFGAYKELNQATTSINPGAGVAFAYSRVEGESVERIAGPSFYEKKSSQPTEERCVEKIILVVGNDYRVHQSSPCNYFELISPPLLYGSPVLANNEKTKWPFNLLFDVSFPFHIEASPPIVRVHIEAYAKHLHSWDNYQGFWRGGLVIDFGKDLPSFIEEKHALPTRNFITDITTAFQGEIVEVGEVS
jgi:hypothetical protein